MSEETTPVQQETSGQQVTQPAAASGENWEARYKGMVPIVEKLTSEKRTLQEQLDKKTSEYEQLSAQLGLKDAEKQAAVTERDKQLQQLLEAQTTNEAEIKRLKSLEMKVQVANELKEPRLLAIVDSIPSVEDKEALTTLMKNIANWGEDIVQKREKEILAGVTEQTQSVAPVQEMPSDNAGWQKYLEGAPLGSTEREQRYEAWRQWGMSQ